MSLSSQVVSSTLADNRHAFVVSLSMVGMAEIFDKTWFVALVMAMRYEKNTVFWSCFLGLMVHVFIAAAFGLAFAKALSPATLNFGAAALYGIFTILYSYDWYRSDAESDLIASGKDEINEEFADNSLEVYGAVSNLKKPTANQHQRQHFSHVFWMCFMAVFIAEWGDRTQIAMIGIHATLPLVPVMLGSAVAFFLLTLSAVIVGTYVGDRTLQESTVKAVCAASFAVFTVLAIHDGLVARKAAMPMPAH